jgi:putative chitinase
MAITNTTDGTVPHKKTYLLSKDQLLQIMPHIPTDKVDTYYESLNTALVDYVINTKLRIAAFLANVAVETNELRALVENLNYSAKLLMSTWPKRFPTIEIANQYARQPEKIANHVYCSRMGNRDEASGDGWKYRGRGTLQLTGHDNYKEAGEQVGVDFLANPDLVNEPKYLFVLSATYWNARNLSVLADKSDFVGVVKGINGGTIMLAERQAYYNQALKVLSIG